MGYFTLRNLQAFSQRNALSIDVEEWFHVCGVRPEPSVNYAKWRVERNIDLLLALLERHNTKATFFVLGSVAEAVPSLVPRIAAAGHEIASHGFSHRLVHELTRAEFRDEVRRTHDILGQQSGQSPVGFSAPQWSLSPELTPWAAEELIDSGYCYDSSCTPLPFVGNRHGMRTPHVLTAVNGSIWEIPPLVTSTPLLNLPTGGGWGLRFFPCSMIERSIGRLNSEGAPAVLYLHPRELDPNGPRLRLPALKSFVTYGPRQDVTPRLERLLKQYSFTTLRNLVTAWESA